MPDRSHLDTTVLDVDDGRRAIRFYRRAFGAHEIYLVEDAAGRTFARLAIGSIEFCLAGLAPDRCATLRRRRSRERTILLVVSDPDTAFRRAIGAGATVVQPLRNRCGRRLGTIADPFGHLWAIGQSLPFADSSDGPVTAPG